MKKVGGVLLAMAASITAQVIGYVVVRTLDAYLDEKEREKDER